jgi:hypothetical protein
MTQESAPLPPAYAHFQPIVEKLSMELRETLAGQLAQLEPLIHLVDEPTLSPRGDMAGLGSLTRHGDLSNILQSELLLRTEAPLEFLRRIAETETLYHEKEYQDDGTKRIMRLMISVGPGMLGYGRILSLAALFFLSRIAHLRQETLHWCYLPNAQGPVWFDEISVNTIKRFLKTASFQEMTVDDAEAAREIWSRLQVAPKSAAKPITIDWVIGAYPHDSRTAKSLAVAQSLRAIGYRLDPPEEEKPRGASLFMKRGGKAHRPISFTFPDDKLCLSALNKPFAPIKPAETGIQGPVPESKRLENWATCYISAPGIKAKFVKVSGGVLILFHPTEQGFKGQYFLPLAQNNRIAGLRLKEQQLHVLLQTVTGPQEQLEYSTVGLSYDGIKPVVLSTQTKALPAAQLFRDQSRYALPVLAGGTNPTFYATNGKPFSLYFDGQDARFTADLDACPVIYSNGQHHVIRTEAAGVPILRTLRTNNTTVHEFSLDSIAFDEATLRGMLYVSTHGQLAFSQAPNIWIVPGQCTLRFNSEVRQISAALQCEFASYERPLSIRRARNGINATVWSDAQSGGDGSIRNLQITNDRIHAQSKLFDLDKGIRNVVEIIQADDGIWIVTADHRGIPETLNYYITGSGRIIHYNLNDLRNAAQPILLRGGGHG